jgi:hypothetical protein
MAAFDAKRWSETARFGALMVLVTACFLLGGASRNDVLSLIVLQPLAVICAAVFLFTPGSIRWHAIRVPLLLLGALAGLMAAQLVPLPPAVWSNLPGHAQFTMTATAAGIEQPWRPISLTPDLTLAGLVGLITPFAALVGVASVPSERSYALLPLLIGAATLSALIGLAQVAQGTGSPFYFYQITNYGSPVGFFSNRNHQAVLLAMAWPMLAVWATLAAESRFYAAKQWIAVSLAIFLLPMMLAAGSRAGLVLGAIGLACAARLWRRRDPDAPPPSRWSVLLIPTALGAALTVVAATIMLSRDAALQRVTGVSFDDEVRVNYLPTLLDIAWDFFPIGAGFGGFDPLFRVYEPLDSLDPTYLNHAHNDLLELGISGGLPAWGVLAVFLVWFARRAVTVLRGAKHGGRSLAFARLGLIIISFALLSSLVDYPLRTPLFGALFAIACIWVSEYGAGTRGRVGRSTTAENALRAGTSPIVGRPEHGVD